ncbi:MAG: type II toxin-antitoxin system RelE/ParE family toxin [Paraglaciecola sp.]|nr:type II toxin-antitoxin system RelE/ParE family toxin [Paraglaciecola sp.]MDP5132843.1 type II toxin-antitoxin system RelE/ParE family toxin [Paraglaciecola sp.]
MDASPHPKDLNSIYGNKFAEKKGSGAGIYSLEVNGNWRITSQIHDDGALLMDYRDYHGKSIKAV